MLKIKECTKESNVLFLLRTVWSNLCRSTKFQINRCIPDFLIIFQRFRFLHMYTMFRSSYRSKWNIAVRSVTYIFPQTASITGRYVCVATFQSYSIVYQSDSLEGFSLSEIAIFEQDDKNWEGEGRICLLEQWAAMKLQVRTIYARNIL